MHALGIKQEHLYIIDQAPLVVPQNAVDIELCLRRTIGRTALAPWKVDVESNIGKK